MTDYRLVTKGTIEEKIVRLHAEKRQLADGILEGADTPGAVPVDELLRLLRDGSGRCPKAGSSYNSKAD